jgi:hypothetical protein
MVGGLMLAVGALLLVGGLLIGSCGGTESNRAKDNFNSAVACSDYCNRKYECENHTPTTEEKNDCVGGCRNSIENNCGNENQAAANKKIEQCVDKPCAEFGPCMVFDAAPSCFGFVDDDATDDDTTA